MVFCCFIKQPSSAQKVLSIRLARSVTLHRMETFLRSNKVIQEVRSGKIKRKLERETKLGF